MDEMRRLYYQTKEIKSFKTFKWLLKGRWNQGTGNSGNTRTYLEWDELGISYVGSNGVKYGPTYWTVDSYSTSGSLWGSRPASEMFDGEWGSEYSKSDYKDINDSDGYVEIIIHTTSGEAIIPNGVGLISSNNQSSYASSTPGHFILYGLDQSTNEYIQLIDVPAANVNKGNTQTTTVSFEPVEVVTGTYVLTFPGWNGYVGYQSPYLNCVFTGDSTIPMIYSVNGDSFTINDGSTVSRTLKVGDTLTITASSTTGKTFSLKGLDNFNSTVTWNHKGEGSSVSYSGVVTSAGEAIIGYDNYRDKEFTAKCSWFRGGGSGCYDYQPALYVDELTTNCLANNNWNGIVYVTDVSEFTSVTQKTSDWNWGYGNRGWANYGSQASWTGWDASAVFNWNKVLNWSVTWTVNIISCGVRSGYFIIYGTHKNGGDSRQLYYNSSYTYPIGQTTNYGPYTGNGSNNKGPVLCIEIGYTSSSYNPVEHEGYCVITGVKR